MTRVLGNAIAIGASSTVRVGWYRGSAGETVHANTHLAALIGLGAVGRPSTHVTLATPVFDNVDVVVIEPQTSDGNATEALATAWATPLHDFLLRGGVAVVLEGSAGTSYRFAAGAQLFTVAPPVDVTDQQAIVVAVGDAIAQGVPVPYLAEGSSVVWPTVSQPAIVVGGETLAFHRWVQ
ncbi:MAG: hypothetical protein NT062_32890 [Proteobacteria bacterium]|nr:hypothetical protein [Pseudomonadota bacterium]